MATSSWTHVIGLLVVRFSALYFASDVIEVADGGFSRGQLWLTLVAEATLPIFVIGLWLVQRPRIGRLGTVSAIAYACSFVFFTGTVIYAQSTGPGPSNSSVVPERAGKGTSRSVARGHSPAAR